MQESPLDTATDGILAAYSQGFFIMADENDRLAWYSSRKPTVMPLDERLHVPKSLHRALNNPAFVTKINTAFGQVVDGCAERPETWINDDLKVVYQRLHQAGHAHSFEVWLEHDDGAGNISSELGGAVLGLTIGAAFIGESMFFRISEASKVALVRLCRHLAAQHFQLFDVQMQNPHLERFGAYGISVREYQQRLVRAVRSPASFLPALHR
jgi:leucyl/phenylalanyl-tRNA---protein transferase